MSDDNIRIDRGELFDPEVDKALARERAGRERIVADAPAVSPIRRLLLNSMFYLPLAAVLASFISWKLLDPGIHDAPIVRGSIVLVNTEPFDLAPGTIQLTVGSAEVAISPRHLKLAAGSDGEPALASIDDLKVGTRIEATGVIEHGRMDALVIRPTSLASDVNQIGDSQWAIYVLFPLTAALIAFGLLFAEGLTTRNWRRMILRALIGTLLAMLFTGLVDILVAERVFALGQMPMESEMLSRMHDGEFSLRNTSMISFLCLIAGRSAAWAIIGAIAGVGMNLVRATRTQLRNSVVGGALGGAFGGLFFDPIDRFFQSSQFTGGSISRLVGLLAVGLSIGIFVALVERLARDAWLRVRTGPLAGKSFILYKTPTVIGNSPESDVYLYKDAEIDPMHAQIHRVGTSYEIEDMDTRMGTSVAGNKVRRRRLVSGDQIVIGSTILDFEERQKRTPAA